MHKYLKSIGYNHLNSHGLVHTFLEEAQKAYTNYESIVLDKETAFCVYQRECGAGIGVNICGIRDGYDNFERDYYYPYFIGSGITSYADVTIERRIDREAYVGICEDMRVGISLIFTVQNVMEYLEKRKYDSDEVNTVSVTFSGLSNGGMILFPVMKSQEQAEQQKKESKNRKMLLHAAKNGDPDAIESLTLEDMDTYSKVTRRLVTEDVFSIVDTYFMPHGIECDRYSILGEILDLQTIQNEDNGEELYIMKLDVNELQFDVCVPVKSIIGEPAVGRRFKGNIWLQGRLNF